MCLIPLFFSLWMTTADVHLSAGLHLAELAHYQQAEEMLVAGRKIAPFDIRFSQELAGLAYRHKDFDSARSYLHDALAGDPRDSYTNNFLATLHYLQGNQEAAVKYWNRAGKPRIDEVHTSDTLQTYLCCWIARSRPHRLNC